MLCSAMLLTSVSSQTRGSSSAAALLGGVVGAGSTVSEICDQSVYGKSRARTHVSTNARTPYLLLVLLEELDVGLDGVFHAHDLAADGVLRLHRKQCITWESDRVQEFLSHLVLVAVAQVHLEQLELELLSVCGIQVRLGVQDGGLRLQIQERDGSVGRHFDVAGNGMASPGVPM